MPIGVTDSLKVYDILKAAQIPELQARAITDAIRESESVTARSAQGVLEAWSKEMATKADLAELRSEFKSDLSDLTRKMFAFWAIQITAFLGLAFKVVH